MTPEIAPLRQASLQDRMMPALLWMLPLWAMLVALGSMALSGRGAEAPESTWALQFAALTPLWRMLVLAVPAAVAVAILMGVLSLFFRLAGAFSRADSKATPVPEPGDETLALSLTIEVETTEPPSEV